MAMGAKQDGICGEPAKSATLPEVVIDLASCQQRIDFMIIDLVRHWCSRISGV